MVRSNLERAMLDLTRRMKRLAREDLGKKLGLPLLLRPRETAAILGIKYGELPALRHVVPALELFPGTIRFRTRDVARLLKLESEGLRAVARAQKKHLKKPKK